MHASRTAHRSGRVETLFLSSHTLIKPRYRCDCGFSRISLQGFAGIRPRQTEPGQTCRVGDFRIFLRRSLALGHRSGTERQGNFATLTAADRYLGITGRRSAGGGEEQSSLPLHTREQRHAETASFQEHYFGRTTGRGAAFAGKRPGTSREAYSQSSANENRFSPERVADHVGSTIGEVKGPPSVPSSAVLSDSHCWRERMSATNHRANLNEAVRTR